MVHDTLHKDLQLSKISQLSDQNGLLLDEKERFRTTKYLYGWTPLFPNHLRQRFQCCWEGWVWRVSWLASPSPRRPPEGVEGGTKNATAADFADALRRCDKSTARTTLRLLVAILIKAKNRKRPNFNGFSFIGSSGFEGNTPRKWRKKRSLSSS